MIREGKGNKDRVTVLPENLIADLKAQVPALAHGEGFALLDTECRCDRNHSKKTY